MKMVIQPPSFHIQAAPLWLTNMGNQRCAVAEPLRTTLRVLSWAVSPDASGFNFQSDIKLSPIALHRSNDTIEFSGVGYQGWRSAHSRHDTHAEQGPCVRKFHMLTQLRFLSSIALIDALSMLLVTGVEAW